jgi:hypothetical protein
MMMIVAGAMMFVVIGAMMFVVSAMLVGVRLVSCYLLL